MTTSANTAEHLTSRPDWKCRLCAQPWPCAAARTSLLAEFEAFPSVLTIYLAAQMYDAMTDLTAHGEPAPRNLYDRFLAWIHADHRSQVVRPQRPAPRASSPS